MYASVRCVCQCECARQCECQCQCHQYQYSGQCLFYLSYISMSAVIVTATPMLQHHSYSHLTRTLHTHTSLIPPNLTLTLHPYLTHHTHTSPVRTPAVSLEPCGSTLVQSAAFTRGCECMCVCACVCLWCDAVVCMYVCMGAWVYVCVNACVCMV